MRIGYWEQGPPNGGVATITADDQLGFGVDLLQR